MGAKRCEGEHLMMEMVMSKDLTGFAKLIDGVLMTMVRSELKRKQVRWLKRMSYLYYWRVMFLRWRREKWLPGLVSEMRMELDERMLAKTNVVYVFFNLLSRKRYIGETRQGLNNRVGQHWREVKSGRRGRKAKAMASMGFENWVLVPLVMIDDVMCRRLEENRLIHKWTDHVINDKWTFDSRSTTFDGDKMEENRRWKMDVLHAVSDKVDVRSFEVGKLWALVEKERVYRIAGARKRKFDRMVLGTIRRYDKRVKETYTLRLPYGNYCEKALLRVMKKELRFGLGSNLGRLVEERLKVMRVSMCSIWDVVNKKKTIHRKIGSGRTVCLCGLYSDEWKIDGHVCVKGCEMGVDRFEKILGINNKTMVRMDEDRFRKKVSDEVFGLYRDVGMKMSRRVKREIENLEYGKSEGVSYGEVEEVLDELVGLVVYELDKNNRTFGVMCERLYEARMRESFSGEQYVEVEEESGVVRERLREGYLKLGIAKLAKPKEKWRMDRAKVIPKNKDLTRMRPIISSSGSMEGRGADWCSRGMTAIMSWIGKRWNTMDVRDRDGAVNEFRRLNLRKQWMKTRRSGSVTFVELDMKNQYTSLRHEHLRRALEAVWEELKGAGIDGVWLSKDKVDKWADKVTVTNNNTKFRKLELEVIREYIEYKLDNCYFMMGDVVKKQIGGVPMGGKVSAQLAEAFCMWREHTNVRKWKGSVGVSTWMRYRDDIRVILPSRWLKSEIEIVVKKINDMYGGGIEVLLERVGYKWMNFLDVRLRCENDEFVWMDNNKNYDFDLKMKDRMKLVRFPRSDGGAPWSVMMGTMIGVMKVTLKKCATEELKERCLWQNILEFAEIGYRTKEIVKAVYATKHSWGLKLRERIRKWCGELERERG